MAEVLVLGCLASGKTLLVRQLRGAALRGQQREKKQKQKKNKKKKAKEGEEEEAAAAAEAAESASFLETLETRATVGVELDSIALPGGGRVTLREVGAAMAPMWPAFFGACAGVVFVVDASDAARLPEAAVELWSLLGAAALEETPVLVVLSKCDAPAMFGLDAVRAHLRVDDARRARSARLDVVAASLADRESCAPILDWIEGNCTPTVAL